MRVFLLSLTLLVVAPMMAIAAPLVADNPRVAIAPNGENAAGYLTLTNPNAKDDAAIALESDCCTAVEIHTTAMEGDVMRMRKVDRLSIPAHGQREFKTGEHHVMFIGLKKTYAEGDVIPVTFTFAQGEKLPVRFSVISYDNLSPSNHSAHH